jgi:hypothetical protein
MTMTAKIVFSRNTADVTINGRVVGRHMAERMRDGSHKNTFVAFDGQRTTSAKREWLRDAIVSADRRMGA